MNPDVWGPGLWLFIHTIALNYSENPSQKERIDNKNFLLSLEKVIPCPGCKAEYSKYIQETPPTLENKSTLIKWTIDLHNSVNERLGKKIRSDDWVANYYKSLYSISILNLFSFNNDWNHPINLIILFVVIVIILCICYNKKWFRLR